MTRTMMRLALAAVLAAPAALMAQPTPEGTVITNTATATWTDANSNTYTAVQATASVTVGFAPSVAVASPASVTPASPSTGNTLAFTLTNNGNGTDQFSVALGAMTGATATAFTVDGNTHLTIGDLNAALATRNVTSNGGSVVVTVTYSVAPGQGGQTIPATLTATSVRQPTGTGSSNASTTNIIPAVAADVETTPDDGTIPRLPSNGTQYSQVFAVANGGNAQDTYALVASTSSGNAATLSIVSVNGSAGASSSVTVAPGASANVTVVYTVANAAAGATDSLRLLATSSNVGTPSDYGAVQISVAKPALTIAKTPYKDDRTTVIDPAAVVVANRTALPGEFIQFRISVTNTGSFAATGVTITDPVGSTYLQSITASPDVAGEWTISTAAGVSATLNSALAAGATRFIWVRAQVKP